MTHASRSVFSTQQLNQALSQQAFNHTTKLVFSDNQLHSETSDKPVNSAITLTVFEQLTLAQLAEIMKVCDITELKFIGTRALAEHTSYKFAVNLANFSQAKAQLLQLAQQQGFDAALLDHAPKLEEPGLLVMDMDSTTIEIECIDEIAKLAGDDIGKQISEVTELAMQGKLDFSQSLRQRVAKLAGTPDSVINQVKQNMPLMPGLKSLIATLKQHHWKIAIASGGFTYFADELKQQLALDAAFANQLVIKDGELTGEVQGDIVDANKKAEVVKLLAKEFVIAPQQTVAMGDGANDLVMMQQAALGVAFEAKPLVQQQADCAINSKNLALMAHYLA